MLAHENRRSPIVSRRTLALALALATIAALVAAAAAATSSAGPARRADTNLTLVAYSTPREAYGKLISEFQKTAAGKDVDFEQSYGASGEQARAVVAGLHADLVALSLEPDVTTLVKAGIVAPGWKNDRFKGIVTRSVVVFAVRRGNPKKIRDWEDLVKPGVQVVTPNVQTSGGAKWNIMAAYGAMKRKKKTHAQAVAYLRKLYTHIVSQDKSAREALQTFLAGRGDVLLAYENEAIFANSKGQDVPYVIPKATIRIENPIAVTKNNRSAAKARAFVRYLRSLKAQRIFAQNGYRPVLTSALKGFSFPVRQQLFTIKWLGGWAKVDKQFFDPKSGIVTKIQRETGRA
jgi:sulfate transport system substrate-binding protein